MDSLNGLDVGKELFKKMPKEDQIDLIYRNVVVIRKNQTNDKFHRKIIYTWCSVLTAGMATVLGLKKWGLF